MTGNELRAQLVAKAISQLGIHENPPKSNSGIEIDQYLISAGSTPGNQWCASFLYWVFNEVYTVNNIPNPLLKTPSVQQQKNYLQSKGKKLQKNENANGWDKWDKKYIVPGTIVTFKGDGDDPAGNHIGIVHKVNDKGQFGYISGNYSDMVAQTLKNFNDTAISEFYYPYDGFTAVYTSSSKETDEQILLKKRLEANLNAIQNNVDMLEKNDTQVNWGARSSPEEQSDWIGLRQYILYLATLYVPQSVIPFVELIPKFLLDEPIPSEQNNVDNQLNEPSLQALINQKKRYMKAAAQFANMQANNVPGTESKNVIGIDLLTSDPFLDMMNFTNVNSNNKVANDINNISNNNKTLTQNRNFGYRFYGNVVLNPEIVGDELSKAGGIGFKSFEISKGASNMNGVTNINIKLEDIQGNKFFDTASPWSFILNSSQIYGDFYFRYGWQIRIPEMPSNSDQFSTEYKFWNHPGWNLFGALDPITSTVTKQSIDELKKKILGLSIKSGVGVLTITQSPNLSSMSYPGYIVSKNNSEIFTIDRRQLDPTNYLIISMINPEVTIDSHTGAITASIEFRMNTALMTCMCPLKDAEMTNEFILSPKENTTLLNLMLNFLRDNQKFSESKSKKPSEQEIEAMNEMINNQGKNNFIVRKLEGKQNMTYAEIQNIPITIFKQRIQEITDAKTNVNNTTQLRTWLYEVLSDNHMSLISAGEPGIGTQQNQSIFQILWDDSGTSAFDSFIKNGVNSPDGIVDENMFNSGTGFLGFSDINRITLQDDVFSFRFRGSLIEDLTIEGSANPSAQNNQNIQNFAGQILYDNIKPGEKGNNISNKQEDLFSKLQSGLYEKSNAQLVTYQDKQTWLGYLMTKVSGLTIKCIAHPWIKVGLTIYVKGNGYFDGKYIVTKIKHLLESNKFTSTINAVRVFNDQEYADHQLAQDNEKKHKQNGGGKNYAQKVQKVDKLRHT